MVPGSTFRYGSHFCRVTLSPRLSSRQPMEAAATPLPREETTPPVTKIYFGAIRKALDFLRENERTRHYGQKRSACQIADLDGAIGWHGSPGFTRDKFTRINSDDEWKDKSKNQGPAGKNER